MLGLRPRPPAAHATSLNSVTVSRRAVFADKSTGTGWNECAFMADGVEWSAVTVSTSGPSCSTAGRAASASSM